MDRNPGQPFACERMISNIPYNGHGLAPGLFCACKWHFAQSKRMNVNRLDVLIHDLENAALFREVQGVRRRLGLAGTV
jgi:hypothetical protein